MKTKLLAVIALLLFAGEASADMGFGPRSADLGFRFNNLEKYETYDFYLKYLLGRNNPKAHLTKVASGTLTRMESTGSLDGAVFVIAVPRGQAVSVPDKKTEAAWLKDPPVGGLQSAALKGNQAGGGLGNGYDITYDVRLDGDKLQVDWVESNLNAWWSRFDLIVILIGAACVLIPLAILIFIIWLIVRLSRRPRADRSRANGVSG